MHQSIHHFLFSFALVAACGVHVAAQTPARSAADENAGAERSTTVAPEAKIAGNLFGLDEVQRQLREQREEIERLRDSLKEQARLIGELRARVEHAEQSAQQLASQPTTSSQTAIQESAPVVQNAAYASAGGATLARTERTEAAAQQQGASGDDRIARAEEQARKANEAITKQLGSINFSGDIRFRYESLYGQQNALATSGNSSELGNPLSTRQRLRLRLRFTARGEISKEFEWGLRLATGTYPDVNSTNQTLTDFFSRKNFALDQAFITYKPAQVHGLQVQAGKFEAPWLRTEMTFDADINPEGINESYALTFKKSRAKDLTFVAWQLPFLERNSAFVVGSNGQVDLAQSGRAGRDLALYGAQLRARIAPSRNSMLTLSAADLYYSGTQFITPAQFFGPNVQFPATFTIPATATTPAQTVTAQVSVPREFLVAGNANLGFSTATTNALNADGRLASGFNLVDLIARLEVTRSKQWPVVLLLNFVHNTQARDIVTSTPGRILPNHEDNGYWAEFQIGKDVQRLPVKDVKRGDFVFNYTFIRIEKDAVLTPFNFSDLIQQSDVRSHRFIIAYALDPRVAVSLTSSFQQRPNSLLGPFSPTPVGSLNRTLRRFQFDTYLRF